METSVVNASDGLRAALVLVFAILQAVMAFWPGWRRWPHTIATRSAALDTPVVPVGATFAIWAPIFAGCIAFGVWQALPGNLDEPFARTVGWPAVAVFAANAAWEWLVPRRGLGWASVLLVGVEALGLAVILVVLEWGRAAWTPVTVWLVVVPFHLFAGWVTAAAVVNLSSVLRARGVTVGPTLSVALLLLAGAVAVPATAGLSGVAYPLAVCWALGGIAVAALRVPGRRAVLATAIGLGSAVAATTVAGVLDRRALPPLPAALPPRTDLPPIAFATTADLQMAYRAYGPDDGPVILVLHGFPDDEAAWHEVAVRLAGEGHRVIAPTMRGFGETRFLSPATVRSGQLAALVADTAAFADALGLRSFAVIGHDWGGRIAQGLAVLHPDRVTRVVSFGGYALAYGLDGPPSPGFLPELGYQFALNLPIGEALLTRGRNAFLAGLWRHWSPTWDDAARTEAFVRAMPAFSGPDFVPVVLSAYSYTGRGHDPRHAVLEARFASGPTVPVATHVIQGADDPLDRPGLSDAIDRAKFVGGLTRQVLQGVGHWPHRERPDAIVALFGR